jgi:cyclophilin family peptidyl-prolyl cis-trans isomerase
MKRIIVLSCFLPLLCLGQDDQPQKKDKKQKTSLGFGVKGGVNFAVFSEHATGMQLLLFERHDSPAPYQIITLDPAHAPKSVENFLAYVDAKHYDGTVFHRIIPGFVVQGGAPTGGGSGGPGYTFEDELPTEGPPFYDVGSLAMANSGPDTNGSQFYVVTGQQGIDLPADYSLFGQVTEGMETVRAIEATGTPEGTPSAATTLESVTITEG